MRFLMHSLLRSSLGSTKLLLASPAPPTAAVLRAHPAGAASKVPDHAEHHQLLRLPVRIGPGQAISRELKAQRALSWPTIDASIVLPRLLHNMSMLCHPGSSSCACPSALPRQKDRLG